METSLVDGGGVKKTPTISIEALRKELRPSVFRSLSRHLNNGNGTTTIPNHETLRIGDVILTRQRRPPFLKDAVAVVQQGKFEEHHAKWTHASLYVGDLHVIESITKLVQTKTLVWRTGVHLSPLTKYSSTHELKVLRYKADDFSTERRKVAAYAFLEYAIGSRKYDFNRAMKLGQRLLKRSEGKALPAHRTRVICSEFVVESFAIGGGFLVDWYADLREQGKPIYPASFSESARFEEIKVPFFDLEHN